MTGGHFSDGAAGRACVSTLCRRRDPPVDVPAAPIRITPSPRELLGCFGTTVGATFLRTKQTLPPHLWYIDLSLNGSG